MYKSSFQLLQKVSLSARTSQVIAQRTSSSNRGQKNISSAVSGTNRKYASTTRSSNQQATAAAAKAEPFLNGSNSLYVEDMYESWLENPSSVHKVSFKICVLYFYIYR